MVSVEPHWTDLGSRRRQCMAVSAAVTPKGVTWRRHFFHWSQERAEPEIESWSRFALDTILWRPTFYRRTMTENPPCVA
jgi:hypothetical protein